MKILVDADACPVKEIIVRIAKEKGIKVTMLFDTSHIYEDGYSTVLYLDKGRDSVDFALVNHIKTEDIVVTGDYGVAGMALAKNAKVISQNGLIYTTENINDLLHSRYLNQKLRNQKIRTKGPKKRTILNDQTFEKNFKKLVE